MYDRPGRPHVRPKYTAPELAAEALSLMGIVLNAFIVAGRWTAMQDTVPYMAPYLDGVRAHKIWILILFSILPLGAYVVLTMLSGRLDRFFYPVSVDDKNAAAEYRLARGMLLSLKAEIVWAASAVLWCLTGAPGSCPGVAPAALLALLAIAVIATIAYYARQMGRHA